MAPLNKYVRAEDLIKQDVDRLIDFYEQFKPDAGMRIEVDCFSSQLTFATLDQDGHYCYRGRWLVPVKKKTQSVKKFNAANQADIDACTMPMFNSESKK